MEGGALFNPGFLGGNFLWWVGQVADDSTWRENVKEGKYKSPSDVPGWGYRYKVRIIGLRPITLGSSHVSHHRWWWARSIISNSCNQAG
jgi:hypothetical protein